MRKQITKSHLNIMNSPLARVYVLEKHKTIETLFFLKIFGDINC